MTFQAWLRQMFVVFKKELRDASRDRRAVYTLLISSAISPILLGFLFNRLADRQRQVEDVTIPVVGIEHAPALIDWMRQQSGVTIVAGPADAETAVKDRKEDVVVVISPEFAKKFRSSSPAQVKVVSDGSRTTSRPKVQRVRGLLQRYSAEIGSMRLVARGVTPGIATAVAVEDVEVSSAQQRAAMILNFIPLFIVLAAFTGGMQIAMDSTAGERERGSLEPLLVNPAPRSVFAAGKWLAAATFSTMSVTLMTGLSLAMLNFIPLQEFGVRFRLSPDQVAGMFVATLPLCFLFPAIQTYAATFARSFKEAQSQLGLMIMIPMLPGMLATIYPLGNRPWTHPIPILGQQVLLSDVLGGRIPSTVSFLLAGVTTLVVAAVLLRQTTELFKRERIIFSR